MVIDKTSNLFVYKKLFSEGILYGIEETLNNTDILFENTKLVNVIDGKLLYRKMSLATVEKSEVCFETHREFVDVQFIIGGGELIDWSPLETLSYTNDYDKEKDVSFYKNLPSYTTFSITIGMFVIFYSWDAHRPMISDNSNKVVEKFVFKVHKSAMLKI